jgi:uncharacterized protein
MSHTVTLILPGLYDSGPEHWQSYWERADPACRRVVQADWETPRCADWVARLDAEIAALHGPAPLVAHSASCALVAHWAASAPPAHLARVRGALLVAPSDPEAPSFPAGPTGFAPLPLAELPFPSTVVASTNDEYVTLDRAAAVARAWGSRFVNAGAAGHLNSASGLAGWPAGRALRDELRRAPAAGTA